jgi:transcriptional regulator GlxA family with amidase domain
MKIAFLIFDKFTALDAMGPYEVFSRFPGAELKFVAKEAGPVRTDTGMLTVMAEASLDEVDGPEIFLIPGGEGNRPLMEDTEVLDWIRSAHETSTWTISVCTGALLLGATGVLDGVRATTHWAYRDQLAELGADVSPDRVVIDGKIATAAGVSSGIDLALTLVGEMAGPEAAQAMQLGIEYDPQPPFDAGSPDKAPPAVVEFVRNLERG